MLLIAFTKVANAVEIDSNKGDDAQVLLPHFSQHEIMLKEKALDGSLPAASELSNLYGMYTSWSQAIFWGMIAAENRTGLEVGKNAETSAIVRYNLGDTLRLSPDKFQRRRALFWLKQVAAGEWQVANYARDRLTEIQKQPYENSLPPGHPEWNRWPKWGERIVGTDGRAAQLQQQAVDGSPQAAAELLSSYIKHSRHAEAVFWGMIAAENESTSCGKTCLMLAHVLVRSSDSWNQRRARYWLNRVIAGHGAYAKDAQKILDQLAHGKIKHDIPGSLVDEPIFKIPKELWNDSKK